MPSLSTTLAWATPVKVEVLGAHLEAHVQLLPLIDTLRLCHRFGRGPVVMITQLPIELITMIADLLTTEAREQRLREWENEFKCFQLLCDPSDHLSQEEYERLRELATRGEIPKNLFNQNADIDERVDEHLDDDLDLWMDAHYTRSNDWEDHVGLKTLCNRGIFTTHKDLIHKHFGLEVWISHVRLQEYPEENYWEITHFNPPETTLAYLMVPGARSEDTFWDLRKDEIDDKSFFIESGYGMPIKIPRKLTEGKRALFDRMMKILALQPFVTVSQADLALSTKGRSMKDDASELSSWPQVMMLSRCVTRSDDED